MNRIVKAIFESLGYDVRRLSPPFSDPFRAQRRLLPAQSPVIFDVGAHQGETARVYRKHFPTARIYCFEPFPESFAILEASLARLPGARAFRLALSDREGTAVFHSNHLSATNSLLATAAAADAAWPGLLVTKEQIEVPTTTLDAFCREHAIDRIDILKLDVQGAEPLVLKGGEQWLRAGRVHMIYTEILTMPTYAEQVEFDEFIRLMKAHGFVLFNLFNLSSTATGQLRQVDAIFLFGGSSEGGRRKLG